MTTIASSKVRSAQERQGEGVPSRLRLLAALAINVAAFTANADECMGAPAVESAIENSIREWFELLELAPADPRALEVLSNEPALSLAIAGADANSSRDLETWIGDLRSSRPQVEFDIDSIRVDPERDGLYRAHFEVERRAPAEDGTLRIARWHQSWWLRAIPGDAPSAVRIEQRPALPFPGTGPRIVCD